MLDLLIPTVQVFIQLFACWVIFHDFLLSADIFQNQLFKKLFQEHYQSVKPLGTRSEVLCWVLVLLFSTL